MPSGSPSSTRLVTFSGNRTQRRIVVDGLGRDPDLTRHGGGGGCIRLGHAHPQRSASDPARRIVFPVSRGRSAPEGTAANASRRCRTILSLLPPQCGPVLPDASWPRAGPATRRAALPPTASACLRCAPPICLLLHPPARWRSVSAWCFISVSTSGSRQRFRSGSHHCSRCCSPASSSA